MRITSSIVDLLRAQLPSTPVREGVGLREVLTEEGPHQVLQTEERQLERLRNAVRVHNVLSVDTVVLQQEDCVGLRPVAHLGGGGME